MSKMLKQQQRAIIEKESAWVDDSFSPLDLSQFSAAHPPPPDQTKGESIAQQFLQACPGYNPTAWNYDTITKTLAFNAWPASQQNGTTDEIVADLIDGGFWTAPNLIACYHALNREGLLDATTAERLHVRRLAQLRRTDEAICHYLRCVIDAAMLAIVERLRRSKRERQCY
jgi:hypothetical protein